MHNSWKSRVGGPWFFWQILLRGILGVVRKSGGSCFIAFLCGSFSKIFIVGTLAAPPPPPPCLSMVKVNNYHLQLYCNTVETILWSKLNRLINRVTIKSKKWRWNKFLISRMVSPEFSCEQNSRRKFKKFNFLVGRLCTKSFIRFTALPSIWKTESWSVLRNTNKFVLL